MRSLYQTLLVLVCLSGCHLNRVSGDETLEGTDDNPATLAAPILFPGNGFDGATEQPDAIGTGLGANENAIARWDVVPFQTFDDEFNVGVVAFHMNNIREVMFAVDGGAWVSVNEMRLNPQTKNLSTVGDKNPGVVEYWAKIRPQDFEHDGLIEVRAIAIPNVGVPRVLPSLFLNVNGHGTLPSLERYVSSTIGDDATGDGTRSKPFRTMVAAAYSVQQAQGSTDGSTIYLMAGDHVLNGVAWYNSSASSNRWMTIKPAPGLSRSDVRIMGSTPSDGSGFNNKLVSFQNLTFKGGVVGGGVLEDYVWFHENHFDEVSASGAAFDHLYVTDSDITNVNVALYGAELVRNVRVDGIGGDVFSGSVCVINSSVTNFVQAPGAHANLHQILGDLQNVVLYGIRSVSSNVQIFQDNAPPIDHAIVNCDIDATNWYAIVVGGYTRHVLYKDSKFRGDFIDYGNIIPGGTIFDNVEINGLKLGEAGYPNTPGVIFK